MLASESIKVAGLLLEGEQVMKAWMRGLFWAFHQLLIMAWPLARAVCKSAFSSIQGLAFVGHPRSDGREGAKHCEAIADE